jgi:RNA polymerase sigma-70 factor (ECF subfamily)
VVTLYGVVEARSLYDAFAAHLAPGTKPADGADVLLDEYLRTAHAAWPTLAVDAEDFARHVAACAVRGAPPPVAHAADLYLAFACARAIPGAAQAYHRAYDAVIARVLSRRRAAGALADDAAQAVHERLLVAPQGSGAPKIAEYGGTGSLKSWVSTTAATTLSMMRRSSARRREDFAGEREEASDLLVAATGPELRYMKERYKSELAEAVTVALGRLSDRDRTLLRLQLGEQMSIDRLAAMYGVNRSTAARWLVAARESLVEAVRDEMRSRLRLSASECQSIAELVRSELHVSIARLLA